MTDLGSRFIQSGGGAVELDGRLVHMSYVFESLPAGALELRMTARGEQEQGVGVRADGGWLTLNGKKFKEGVLWTATAPETVEITAVPHRGEQFLTVRLWNVWKDPRWGSTMAWVANAGLLVESSEPGAVRLRASTGPGDPTFDDLLVEASFRPDEG